MWVLNCPGICCTLLPWLQALEKLPVRSAYCGITRPLTWTHMNYGLATCLSCIIWTIKLQFLPRQPLLHWTFCGAVAPCSCFTLWSLACYNDEILALCGSLTSSSKNKTQPLIACLQLSLYLRQLYKVPSGTVAVLLTGVFALLRHFNFWKWQILF